MYGGGQHYGAEWWERGTERARERPREIYWEGMTGRWQGSRGITCLCLAPTLLLPPAVCFGLLFGERIILRVKILQGPCITFFPISIVVQHCWLNHWPHSALSLPSANAAFSLSLAPSLLAAFTGPILRALCHLTAICCVLCTSLPPSMLRSLCPSLPPSFPLPPNKREILSC